MNQSVAFLPSPQSEYKKEKQIATELESYDPELGRIYRQIEDALYVLTLYIIMNTCKLTELPKVNSLSPHVSYNLVNSNLLCMVRDVVKVPVKL